MRAMFSVRELIRNVPRLSRRNRASRLGIAPEFDDLELIRLAAPDAVLSSPGWDRQVAMVYGGLRRV